MQAAQSKIQSRNIVIRYRSAVASGSISARSGSESRRRSFNCDCPTPSRPIEFAFHSPLPTKTRTAFRVHDQGGSTMSRCLHLAGMFVLLPFAASLLGCGGSPKLPAAAERLPGKWHGEMIVYEETQAQLPPDKIAALSQMRMDFEFAADGSMALSGVDQGRAYTTAGRWQVVKQEGDFLTIKSQEQAGPIKDINIEFDGADAFFIPLKTEVAELGAMRFTRMR